MLKIRKEQMDVFQQQAEINFVDYVVKQLRNNYTEAVKDVPKTSCIKGSNTGYNAPGNMDLHGRTTSARM